MPDAAPPTRPRASKPPAGWVVAPPDYVGVGVAGAGTEWWHGLVASHPHVSRAPGVPAAIGFFDDRWSSRLDEATVAAYHAHFARPPGARAGEWSPDYMVDAWTPRLLRQAAPEARLLVLLRDPVARFWKGRSSGEDPASVGATPRVAANAAFGRGSYAHQLLRLWRSFPRDQVLVLQFERCVRETEEQLTRTFEFLRLDPTAGERRPVQGADDGARFGGAPAEPSDLDAWRTEVLARAYGPENERLARLVPDLDLDLWARPR